MTFRQLQAFLLVVRTGTLASAADTMGLTQSGVSRLIAELARNVGFELFDKAGRGVRPTARGLAFFNVAEGVYDNAQTLQRVAAEIREGVNDRIRLACIPTIATAVLPAVLEGFHLKYPNVFIDILAQQPPEMIASFGSRKLDFGVTVGFCQMDGVQTLPFAQADYIVAVHAEHVLAKMDVVTSRDLAGHSLIGFENDSVLLPNDDETRLLAGEKASKRIWCQSSWVRYALLSNKRHVNIAEPFSFPLFAPHNVVARPYLPKVAADLRFVLPAEHMFVPMYRDLCEGFRRATVAFAAQHDLPIRVAQEP
ncbi:LysR family transcriptional regulator [Albirhodobacter sp. R86504]|uniref:LysR family transcriptional regulator n=1 Tax=Albirhodobacter sp. R86504 TaxID=3093848 RepID=UPI0036733479